MKNSKFPENDSVLRNACLAALNLSPESAQKISTWVSTPHDFLLYLGSPGCGKTYFCAAMVNYLAEKKTTFSFWFERDFFSGLREVIERGWDPIVELEKLNDVPFAILDDMGCARADKLTDWQREMLFNFVDIRSMSRLPTIITSNHYLKNIKLNFEERFFSRLAAKRNTIIELKEEDLRQVYD